jgi:chemotaxis signal transduction protein
MAEISGHPQGFLPIAPLAGVDQDLALVLRQRAADLAAWRPDEDTAAEREQLVVFGVGQERWGISLRWVREVLVTPPLRAIPGTPRWVRGVTLHRGAVLAIFDFKEFLGLPGPAAPTPWVVVMQGQGSEFAVAVQDLAGCLDVDLAELAQARTGDALGTQPSRVPLLGITAERLAVIDGARLLASPELVVDQTT